MQIAKEALAIIWGVKKFHVYLFGRSFTLYTDHQALKSVLHPHKSIPVVTAVRVQRYVLLLAGYDFQIEYRNTKCKTMQMAFPGCHLKPKREQKKLWIQ